MRRKLPLTIVFMSTLLAFACSGDIIEDDSFTSRTETGTLPEVDIVKISTEGKSANIECAIISEGTAGIKRTGIVYSKTNKKPIIKGGGCSYRALIADDEGNFKGSITTVTVDAMYFIRAFAISNNSDTIYSEVDSFKITKQNPKIETLPVENRVKFGAIVCGRFIDAGNQGIKSWGCCIAKHALPTLKDTFEAAADTAKDEVYHGEFGIFFDNLTENTMYHTRAYVITEEKDTIYGEDRIFKTSKGGKFNWEWASNYEGAVADGAAERIKVAMDSAKYYYDNYSNMEKRIYVEYNTGVPTADCAITGWMRFGSNSRYQWVGTAEHECAHALGVGTASNWGSLMVNGSWKKSVAQRTQRAMLKDQQQVLKGDGMHFWNGGINQQEEVTNGTTNSYGVVIKNERMLKTNALIVNGMRIDGLTSY